MRTSYDMQWIELEGGAVVGVALGTGACSEHEWGIVVLKSKFGVDSKLEGLDAFRIHAVPDTLAWVGKADKKGNIAYAGFTSNLADAVRDRINPERAIKNDLYASWDSRDFFVVGFTPLAIGRLRLIFEAVMAKQAFMRFGIHVFGGPGLCILDARGNTKMWESVHNNILERQLTSDKWHAEWAAETEGLFEQLTAMHQKVSRLLRETTNYRGVPWMSLPLRDAHGAWSQKSHSIKDETPKRVWLNPYRQDLWHFGWYTSEDLRAWVVGDGPIWPLFAAMPAGDHPFWAKVYASVPAPDAPGSRWPRRFPFVAYNERDKRFSGFGGPYHDGCGFWHWAAQTCGVQYAERDVSRLFHEEIQECEAQGLPSVVEVTDLQVLEAAVAEWNSENSTRPVDFVLIGRGTPRLRERLA